MLLEAGLARTLISTLAYAPRPVADRMGRACANLLDTAIPRLRRIADQNLARAWPDRDAEWRKQTIDGVFGSIGRLLVDLREIPADHKSERRRLDSL